MDLKEKYLERIEAIIAQIRENMAVLDSPEKEQFAQQLEEIERIAHEYLSQ